MQCVCYLSSKTEDTIQKRKAQHLYLPAARTLCHTCAAGVANKKMHSVAHQLCEWFSYVTCCHSVRLSHYVIELKLNAFQHHCTYSPSAFSTASKQAQRFTKWAILHMQFLRHWGTQRTRLPRDAFAMVLYYCPGFWLYKCTFRHLWITQRFIQIYTDCYTTEGDCIVLSSDAVDKPHCDECYGSCDLHLLIR